MTTIEEDCREELADLGLSQEATDRFMRLMNGTSTQEEIARWKETGIMTEDGKMKCSKEEMKCSKEEMKTGGITVVLWNMCFEGKISRVELSPALKEGGL
jgi:hypothetical protein